MLRWNSFPWIVRSGDSIAGIVSIGQTYRTEISEWQRRREEQRRKGRREEGRKGDVPFHNPVSSTSQWDLHLRSYFSRAIHIIVLRWRFFHNTGRKCIVILDPEFRISLSCFLALLRELKGIKAGGRSWREDDSGRLTLMTDLKNRPKDFILLFPFMRGILCIFHFIAEF